MKKIAAILCVLMILALSGCGDKELDPEKLNTVKVGQTVSIALDENQSIPYRWEPEISDDSLIELSSDEIKRGGALDNKPGSGGEKHIFYFEALRPGDCTINMHNVRIGEDEIEYSYSFTIRVKE